MPAKGVALVTGASYGLGSHIAKQLASAKWEVVLVARSRDKLETLATEIRGRGGEAEVEQCDMSCRASVVTMVNKVTI